MRYLLTPSLLSSWRWFIEHAEKEKDQADIRRTLAREKFTPNEAMQAGIDFENHVMAFLRDKTLPQEMGAQYLECVMEVAEEVRGGSYQVKANRELILSARTFLIYGRLDAVKADTIYDIKFTGSPYEIGKYQDSPQHKAYFYVLPDVPRFVYLTSDGKQVWHEDYQRSECRSIQEDAHDFNSWLNTYPEYAQLYAKNWVAYS